MHLLKLYNFKSARVDLQNICLTLGLSQKNKRNKNRFFDKLITKQEYQTPENRMRNVKQKREIEKKLSRSIMKGKKAITQFCMATNSVLASEKKMSFSSTQHCLKCSI